MDVKRSKLEKHLTVVLEESGKQSGRCMCGKASRLGGTARGRDTDIAAPAVGQASGTGLTSCMLHCDRYRLSQHTGSASPLLPHHACTFTAAGSTQAGRWLANTSHATLWDIHRAAPLCGSTTSLELVEGWCPHEGHGQQRPAATQQTLGTRLVMLLCPAPQPCSERRPPSG